MHRRAARGAHGVQVQPLVGAAEPVHVGDGGAEALRALRVSFETTCLPERQKS